jgi:hypothetical protein
MREMRQGIADEDLDVVVEVQQQSIKQLKLPERRSR